MKRNISAFFVATIMLLSISSFAVLRYVEERSTSLPYYGNAQIGTTLSNARKKGIASIPYFSFTNQYGKTIDYSFVDHKIWVGDFFFTRCGSVCPKMNSHLQSVQKAYVGNNEVKMLSFTCDPAVDTPQMLNNYADRYTTDHTQWQFLTGRKQDLYRFARKGLGIVATDGDGGADDFIHSQNLVLVDGQGFVRGYYDGLDDQSVKQLILDIKKLL